MSTFFLFNIYKVKKENNTVAQLAILDTVSCVSGTFSKNMSYEDFNVYLKNYCFEKIKVNKITTRYNLKNCT